MKIVWLLVSVMTVILVGTYYLGLVLCNKIINLGSLVCGLVDLGL